MNKSSSQYHLSTRLHLKTLQGQQHGKLHW